MELSDLLAEGIAIHIGEHDIQDTDSWSKRGKGTQHTGSVGLPLHLKSLLLQGLFHDLAKVWFILDIQNPGFHDLVFGKDRMNVTP